MELHGSGQLTASSQPSGRDQSYWSQSLPKLLVSQSIDQAQYHRTVSTRFLPRTTMSRSFMKSCAMESWPPLWTALRQRSRADMFAAIGDSYSWHALRTNHLC